MSCASIMEQILQQTLFLNDHYDTVTMRQRLWHVENQQHELIRCCTCGIKPVGWNIKNLRYSRFCSSKCSQKNKSVREKTQQTCLTRYGATSNLMTQENQKKQQETNLKKYGVPNPAQAAHVIAKIKQTHMKNWGTDNASKHPEIKQKITNTNQERYHRDRHSQLHIPQNIIDLKNDRELMLNWFQDQQMPLTEIAEALGVNHSQLCVHFKNNLNIDISRHAVSVVERQVRDFVGSLVQCEFNNRTLIAPRELDILIPEYRIAIEVDGLAWHTESRGKHPKYHWQKSQQCQHQGWRLINILDIEWQQKPELTKSRIKSALGLNRRVGARSCKLVELSHAEANDFLNENHTQGGCASSVRLGLIQNDQLMSVMTFGRSRFDKKSQWELIRYASAIGVNVQGGASKLWKYFLNSHQPQNVISYCDVRLNTGGLYQQLGFLWQRENGPNYWYTFRYKTFENRIRYQKHKLAGLLDHFDPNQTEWANMKAHGWDRYWDCGSSVWVWSASC